MEETEKESIKSASEEISKEFKTLINAQDLDSLKQLQNLMFFQSILFMFCCHCNNSNNNNNISSGIPQSDVSGGLGRLQDSNAVLSHFNEYSEHCFAEVSADFSRNTRLLKSMKSDLDYIFLKLRNMKAKIISTYPDALPDDTTIKSLDQRPDLEVPQ